MLSVEKFNRRVTLILSFIAILSTVAFAQGDVIKNQIGDKAPELRFGKWLKGTPINKYEPGRLYIVEFWATWCGPCIQMMPHLSKLAKEREKEITVIGVNIWESHGDSAKRYASFLPKVERFVKGMGDKMAYNIITDTDDEYMGNNWMKAGGQEGIPCSFMIKDGTIMWIGHPIALDSMIAVVSSPNYDVAAARKASLEKKSKTSTSEGDYKTTMKSFNDALKLKDFVKAFKIVDDEIGKNLSMASMYSFFKFQALLENVSEDSAMAFLKKWQSGYGGFGFKASLGAIICKKPGLKKESYQYGINLLKGVAEGPNSIPPLMYNMIAEGYANMGDYATAVETQQKVVNLAKQALKEGKYAGFILEDTLEGYEKTLADYKKHLK